MPMSYQCTWVKLNNATFILHAYWREHIVLAAIRPQIILCNTLTASIREKLKFLLHSLLHGMVGNWGQMFLKNTMHS